MRCCSLSRFCVAGDPLLATRCWRPVADPIFDMPVNNRQRCDLLVCPIFADNLVWTPVRISPTGSADHRFDSVLFLRTRSDVAAAAMKITHQ